MPSKAVFLDLNGTIVMPVQVQHPSEYQPIPGSIEAVRLLKEAGFVCPVVTIQSRIEKGVYSEADFRGWFRSLQAMFEAGGAQLSGLYLCPHSAKTECECHKPKPKLYQDAMRDFDLDAGASYVVGDTIHDLRAGRAIGAKSCFVLTGWADRYAEQARSDASHTEADFIGADILAVARWIVGQG